MWVWNKQKTKAINLDEVAFMAIETFKPGTWDVVTYDGIDCLDGSGTGKNTLETFDSQEKARDCLTDLMKHMNDL